MTLPELKSRVQQLSGNELKAFATWLKGYLAGCGTKASENRFIKAEARAPRELNSLASIARKNRTFKHIPGISVSADLEEVGDLRFRYSLVITHDRRDNRPETACVIMQNPSDANANEADLTIKKLERIVFEKDHPDFRDIGRLIVVNLFARIQTTGFQGLDEEIGSRNDRVLEDSIQQSDLILIGWGASCAFKSRQQLVWDLIRQSSEKRVFVAKKHPGYCDYDDFMYRHEPSAKKPSKS